MPPAPASDQVSGAVGAARPPSGGRAVLLAGVGLAALAAYLSWAYRAAFANFFFDDELLYLAQALAHRSPAYVFTTFVQGFPRPLVHLYFYAAARLFDAAPARYYAAGAALFAANVALFVAAARRILGGWPWAAAAGAVAGVAFFPYETLYNVAAGATELLCGLFFFATVIFYQRYRERPGPGRLALVAGALALAYAAKESALSLLPLLVVYELTFGEKGKPQPWRAWGLLAALTAAYVALEIYLQFILPGAPNRGRYMLGPLAGLNWITATLTILAAAFPPGAGALTPLKLLGWLAAWAAAFVFLKPRRERGFGLAWIAVTLAPFIFWQVPIVDAMPRYLFLPAFGVALMLAATLRDLTAKLKRPRLGWALGAVAVAGLALANGVRIPALAPRFLEPGARVRDGVRIIRANLVSGRPLYLYRDELLEPWQYAPVNAVFFGGALAPTDVLPETAADGARLLTRERGRLALLSYRQGFWRAE